MQSNIYTLKGTEELKGPKNKLKIENLKKYDIICQRVKKFQEVNFKFYSI